MWWNVWLTFMVKTCLKSSEIRRNAKYQKSHDIVVQCKLCVLRVILLINLITLNEPNYRPVAVRPWVSLKKMQWTSTRNLLEWGKQKQLFLVGLSAEIDVDVYTTQIKTAEDKRLKRLLSVHLILFRYSNTLY